MSEDAAEAENVDPASGDAPKADAADDAGNGDLSDADGDESTARALADLADRVADHDADLAAEVEDAAERVADLESTAAERAERIEELEEGLKRKQADFENYKKRAERKREEVRERATEEFVERIVEVRDNLVRALAQDEDDGLRDGIESTLASFDEALAEENVDPIEPDAGDDLDPVRHEVLMRTESDQPEGTVVDCYRPGYEMAGRVLQTAQVTVSEGPDGHGSDE